MSVKSLIGARLFTCAAGSAGSLSPTFREMLDYDDLDGGGLKVDDLSKQSPIDGHTYAAAGGDDMSSLTLNVTLKDAADGAFGTDNDITFLDDALADHTALDFVKMVPVGVSSGTTNYEVTVYTGYISDGNSNKLGAKELRNGKYTIRAYGVPQYFKGTIVSGSPVLVAR